MFEIPISALRDKVKLASVIDKYNLLCNSNNGEYTVTNDLGYEYDWAEGASLDIKEGGGIGLSGKQVKQERRQYCERHIPECVTFVGYFTTLRNNIIVVDGSVKEHGMVRFSHNDLLSGCRIKTNRDIMISNTNIPLQIINYSDDIVFADVSNFQLEAYKGCKTSGKIIRSDVIYQIRDSKRDFVYALIDASTRKLDYSVANKILNSEQMGIKFGTTVGGLRANLIFNSVVSESYPIPIKNNGVSERNKLYANIAVLGLYTTLYGNQDLITVAPVIRG